MEPCEAADSASPAPTARGARASLSMSARASDGAIDQPATSAAVRPAASPGLTAVPRMLKVYRTTAGCPRFRPDNQFSDPASTSAEGTLLGKAVVTVLPADDVIEDTDAHARAGVGEAPGEQPVGLARAGIAAGVVVHEDGGRGPFPDQVGEDVARHDLDRAEAPHVYT